MSGMGNRYTAESNVIVGTLDLWKVRGRMPMRMHEKRKFFIEKDGQKYVHIIDISKFNTILEEYRLDGETMHICGRSRVSDMYYEQGKLVVNIKKGFINFS